MPGRGFRLSKSKYLAGLQCPKRLWLQCRGRDLRTPPDAATQAMFDQGTEVGERARLLFPGGVLVSEGPWQHPQAIRHTSALLRDPNVPAIFEAAFEHLGVRIRVDVLERLEDGGVGLREVKASNSVKDHHIDDLAVQRFVLEGCGLGVGSVELVHVNRGFVRGDGAIDWPEFFVRQGCGEEVERRLEEVSDGVASMHQLVGHETPPDTEPGPHCHKPVGCEFWEHCTRDKPDDWVEQLPYLQEPLRQRLREGDCERISLLPPDLPLTSLQARVRDAVCSGCPYVSPALAQVLRAVDPPLWYLDFETIGPAIPLYPGTSPYQVLPFQWSLHRLEPDGALTHREFLASGTEDPRRAVAESLIDALSGNDDPVLVYTGYEQRQLAGLMRALPDLEEPLHAITERLVDLHQIVKSHLYHPGFHGSFSIKAVAPALVPGFGYHDLDEVAEGAAASAAFLHIARGELGADQEQRTREALLAYCQRDTLAMVEVHGALRELAGVR
jgi:hypothetical protein